MTSNKLLWDQTMPLLKLRGEGARAFLNGQTTADFLNAQDDSLIHSCWLNSAGRVRAILEVRLIDNGAEVVVLGGDIEDLIRSFDQVIFPADCVSIAPLMEIRRVQYLDLKQILRFENIRWFLPDQQLLTEVKGCQPLTIKKLQRWRMEHGLPFDNSELDGKNNPFELGLSNLVSLKKGCFLGQETIAKLARAGHVKKQLRFWESDEKIVVGQKLRAAFSNSVPEKTFGVITSSIADSETGCSFGLAIVRSSVFLEQEVSTLEGLTKVRLQFPIGFVGLPGSNSG